MGPKVEPLIHNMVVPGVGGNFIGLKGIGNKLKEVEESSAIDAGDNF